LGPGGKWNDTEVPRALYMDPWIGPQNGWEHESWDLTESELRGGIDGSFIKLYYNMQINYVEIEGIVIAENLPRWMDINGRLRLSQVLDMYYSDRGVSFDNEIKACRRSDLVTQFVPLAKLREQVFYNT